MTRPLISFRNLLVIFLLALSTLGHSTTVSTATPIIDPFGQPFTGTLTLQLPFAGVLISGGQLVLPTPVSVTVKNGLIASAFVVPGNDTMSPVMPYGAIFSDQFGTPVARQFYYITGSTFDIGSAPAVPNFTNTNGFATVGTCVNQFIRTLSSGVPPTCSTVGTSDLAPSLGLVTPDIGTATGSNLTLSGVFQSGNGTAAAPAITFSGLNLGLWRNPGVSLNTSVAGASQQAWGNNNTFFNAATTVGWAATSIDASGTSAFDTNLSRAAAGVIQAGTSAANSSGIFRSAQFQSNGSQSNPAHSYTSEIGSGWFWQQAGIQGLARSGTYLLQVNGTQFSFGTGQVLCFSSGAPNSVACDAGISRFNTGIVGISASGTAAGVDGTLRVARIGTTRWAEDFPGADWVTRVNAADADFAGSPGEIWMSQAAGTSASTALALTAGRRVRFVQGGTYTTSVGLTLGAGQCIIGSGEHSTSPGNEAVIKASNASNLAFVVSTGSGNSCLENLTIDGNKSNNPSGGVGLKIVDAGRFEASNVTVQNSPTHGVWIFSTGTGDLSCCAKFKRMFVFQNNGNGFYGQNTADVFVSGQTEVENNGVDAVVNCATTTCTFVSGTVWSNNTASLAGTHVLLAGTTLTVSSVTSTTMVFTTTVGTLTGVHLYSGGGYELSDSPTWRIEDTDIGGNAMGGILVVGTDAGIHSDEEIITGNQFGNNLGYDISTFGFGSSGYVGTGHSIYGNTFIGCGGVGTCLNNNFAMIAMNDDKNSSIVGNVFDNHATIKKAFAVQISEGAANRNLGTRIGPNTYGVGASALGTANTNCTTSSSGGMCAMDSTRATIIICPSQGQAGPVTGTAGDAPIFSCTIPAWTIGLIRSIRVHVGWNHTTGTATVTYKGFYGANSAQIASSTLAGEASGIFYVQASAATNAQTIITDPFYNGTTIVGGITRTGIATDSTTAQTLKVTFNVAATDQVTPTEFWAELIY